MIYYQGNDLLPKVGNELLSDIWCKNGTFDAGKWPNWNLKGFKANEDFSCWDLLSPKVWNGRLKHEKCWNLEKSFDITTAILILADNKEIFQLSWGDQSGKKIVKPICNL